MVAQKNQHHLSGRREAKDAVYRNLDRHSEPAAASLRRTAARITQFQAFAAGAG